MEYGEKRRDRRMEKKEKTHCQIRISGKGGGELKEERDNGRG
jgi:hypothetical protein